MPGSQLLKRELPAASHEHIGFDGAPVPRAVGAHHVRNTRLNEGIDSGLSKARTRGSVIVSGADGQAVHGLGRGQETPIARVCRESVDDRSFALIGRQTSQIRPSNSQFKIVQMVSGADDKQNAVFPCEPVQ